MPFRADFCAWSSPQIGSRRFRGRRRVAMIADAAGP